MAKQLIEAHYGRPARLAYWNSCSNGGRALTARQGARAEMPHGSDSGNVDECSLES